MSTSGYAVPPYVFEQKGTFAGPYTFNVPASLEIRPDTATATFDGTGASGSFLACLTFYSPDGARLCRMFNPTVIPTGDVAEVTYIPPFGSAATSSTSGGSGIQFDTEPQAGTWLDWETTGTDGSGWGRTEKNAFGALMQGTDGANNATLELNQTTASNGVGFETLLINADDGGKSTVQVFAIEANGSGTGANPQVQGGNFSATGSGNTGGSVTGISVDAEGFGGTNHAAIIGADVSAETSGTGTTIGARITAAHNPGGTGTLIPLQVFVGGTKVFQINADGSLHGLTGQSLTFDL